MKKISTVSIIIPSFNGAHILSETLHPLCELIAKENPDTEMIIVDDSSSDNTIDFVKTVPYPIKVVANKKRGGFQRSCNNGAKEAKGDLLFFLNNDMLVDKTLLPPLIKHFQSNNNLFAVSPSSIVNHNGKQVDEVPTKDRWENGFFYVEQFIDNPPEYLSHASGGCMCVRNDLFLELGGFDDLFYPAYFEDVDLCWRARKKGYVIIHEPKVRLFHKSHTTLNRVYDETINNVLYWKNFFLFIWKNITDEDLKKNHYDNLLGNLIENSRTTSIIPGFRMALKLIDKIQNSGNKKSKFTDKQLLGVS